MTTLEFKSILNALNLEIIQENNLIGFKYDGKNTYNWFKDLDGNIKFDHCYSCNTSKTIKTWDYGFSVLYYLSKRYYKKTGLTTSIKPNF